MPDKQELYDKLWTSFRMGIQFPKATSPRDYLNEIGLDYKTMEIGFNSGQFHHRQSDKFKKDYFSIGMLKKSDASVRSKEMTPYYCVGRYSIVFPLKNKASDVVNFYFIKFKKEGNPTEYLNKEGLYPEYPNHLTHRLYITKNVIDCATFLQSKILENRDSVLALHEGEFLNQHKEAISRLTELKEIILID